MEKRDIWERLSTILCIAVVVWFFWSWLEIVTHNRTDCQYSAFNMWVLVLKLCNVYQGV